MSAAGGDVTRPSASTMPRTAARRLDRLSRAAHRFHRFAHHPLCDEYASEVIRVGRKARICRGCATALAGALLGAAGASAAPRLEPTLGLAALAVGALTALASFAIGSRTRSLKWLTRGLPTFALAFAGVAGVRGGGGAGGAISLGGLATLAGTVALYRVRKPDRAPCAVCPERDQAEPCRGLRPIVWRERAFQRRARSLVSAAFEARAR